MRSNPEAIFGINTRRLTQATKFGWNRVWACNGTATICPRPLQVVTQTATQNFQLSLPTLVMRIILHPYTKFEVRRPCRSADMADF